VEEDESLGDESTVQMKVNAGSKVNNLMGFALKKLKDPTVKRLTWTASGQAVAKAITCAEITKRKVKNLYQITSLKYKRIEEYWEPTTEGLERLKVNRDIPAISILLSKDALDTNQLGYQGPNSCDLLSRPKEESSSFKTKQGSHKNKRRKNNPPSSEPGAQSAGKKHKETKSESKKDHGKTEDKKSGEKKSESLAT